MSNIVTDSLMAYWNTKQGVTGSVWANIAPATIGSLNGSIQGATLQKDGMYFDGVDDKIAFNSRLLTNPEYTFEFWFKPESNGFTTSYIFSNGLADRSFSYRNSNGVIQYNYSNLTSSPLTLSQFSHVVIVLKTIEDTKYAETFINGVSSGLVVQRYIGGVSELDFSTWSFGGHPSSNSNTLKGHLESIKIYNKPLTQSEIIQNLNAGRDIGLSNNIPPATPTVIYISTDNPKISDETNKNQSNITVKFDVDIIEYVARLNGTSHDTGVLVHQGGAVPANTNAQVIIDWNELTTEGNNRINVYGKSSGGLWTAYENN